MNQKNKLLRESLVMLDRILGDVPNTIVPELLTLRNRIHRNLTPKAHEVLKIEETI